MNDALPNRVDVAIGLVVAAATATWWLGSTHLAIDQGTDAGRRSAEALYALLLIRGMALAVTGVRVAALHGWSHAARTGVGLVAPSWPLVLLAWSATAIPWTWILLAEALLLAGSFAVSLIGLGLRRWLQPADFAVTAGTVVGTGLAASIWFVCGAYGLVSP